MRLLFILRLFVVFVLPLAAFTESVSANSLNRDSDPVVLTGAALTGLLGEAPGSIVAFRYESGWVGSW
ncbi:MAG: hypothetical protein OEN01_11440 [Candidatus Krumholzibacteria bacterium]|nr:hypothetical protein [Candidatus Krumholzibacteria bacterium]